MTTKTIIAALALTVLAPSVAQALAPCHLAPRASACTIDSAADQRHIASPSPDRFRLLRQPFADNWQDWYNGEHGSISERNHALSQQTQSTTTTVIQQAPPAPPR